MSISSGPNLITNGLVFNYDISNTQESWKGAPTTNVFNTVNISSWYKSPGIASVVSNQFYSPDISQNAYLVSTTGSAGSYISNGSSVTLNVGTTYTKSIYAKSGSTGVLVFEQLDNNGSGGLGFFPTFFNLNTGVVTSTASGDTSQITPIGDGWYRCSVSRTLNLSTSPGTFYIGTYGVGTGNLYLAYPQLELLSVPSVYTSGTRSNTQALLDLTGNNTITANSLTYASNGSFSFNGSSNYISSVLPYQFLTSGVTISVWFYYVQATTNDNLISWGTGAFNYANNTNSYAWEIRIRGSSSVEFSPGVGPGGSGSPTRLSYSQSPALNGRVACIDVTFVANGVAAIYENGVFKNSVDYTGIGTYTNTNTLKIGNGTDSYFNGNIYSTKLYNRALSAAEISQNFNALRGRYGI